MKGRRLQEEYYESVAFWDWAQTQELTREHLFAIPNGGSRNIIEAARMKRQGVRKGVSDYFLPCPFNSDSGGYIPGLWIEMKKKKHGVTSPEQKEWLNKMLKFGYVAEVAHGSEEAILITKNYINAFKRRKLIL
jgi:hypothetical protein